MKKKRLFRYTIVSVPIIFVMIAFIVVLRSDPYQHIKGCLYSNKDDFEQIPVYLRNMYVEGDTYLIVDEDSGCDEIKLILSRLRSQYQNGSEYPVFSSIEVHYDTDGDMLFYIQAKKRRLKNRDGIERPDIRCYELVYIDEDYDGNPPVKDTEPFCDNWYTWSFDTYSG